MDILERYHGWLQGYSDHLTAVLRLGLGTFMVLSGVLQLWRPDAWMVVFDPFFTAVVPMAAASFITFHGILMIVEGGLILVDRFTVLMASIFTVGTASVVVNVAVAGAGDAVIVAGFVAQALLGAATVLAVTAAS